jgi:hypothetical protein
MNSFGEMEEDKSKRAGVGPSKKQVGERNDSEQQETKRPVSVTLPGWVL